MFWGTEEPAYLPDPSEQEKGGGGNNQWPAGAWMGGTCTGPMASPWHPKGQGKQAKKGHPTPFPLPAWSPLKLPCSRCGCGRRADWIFQGVEPATQ